MQWMTEQRKFLETNSCFSHQQTWMQIVCSTKMPNSFSMVLVIDMHIFRRTKIRLLRLASRIVYLSTSPLLIIQPGSKRTRPLIKQILLSTRRCSSFVDLLLSLSVVKSNGCFAILSRVSKKNLSFSQSEAFITAELHVVFHWLSQEEKDRTRPNSVFCS